MITDISGEEVGSNPIMGSSNHDTALEKVGEVRLTDGVSLNVRMCVWRT